MDTHTHTVHRKIAPLKWRVTCTRDEIDVDTEKGKKPHRTTAQTKDELFTILLESKNILSVYVLENCNSRCGFLLISLSQRKRFSFSDMKYSKLAN